MFRLFILFVLVPSLRALNDSDYNRMPQLYHLDGFEECFDEPDAIFCYGEFALVSDEPNELLTMIEEYSDNFRHFNHTLLRYGYCMKKTCNEFYNVSESDVDLRLSFEACSNKTIYNKYKLKTRLTDVLDCSKRDRDVPIDNLDIFVGVICILIIMANLIASLCDRYLDKAKEQGGLKLLCNFSIFRNWKNFTSHVGERQDPRIRTLKGIHGIRAINISLVAGAHAFFAGSLIDWNPKLIESYYDNKLYNLIMNGPLIMQSFFISSAFLLVYNWLMDSETRPITWSTPLKQILVRWLRLTPAYIIILGLTGTWFKRLASGGPIWAKALYYESRDCREVWWKHILYFNNYSERSNCMVQSWYLAADIQLYIFAVVIFFICRTNRTRKVILSVLFVVGMIIPVLVTYFYELVGILIASPDQAFNLFFGQPTFELVYSKGHTNLPGYIIGMALGYIIYNWQKNGGDPKIFENKKFQKYRYVYWSLPVVAALICYSGYIFFAEGPPLPTYVHLLYAAFQKPAFALAIAIIIAGLIIRLEGVYRSILEWRPFILISRLSYSIYLIHAPVIRTNVALIMAVQNNGLVGILLKTLTLLVSVYIASFFFYLAVELPFFNIVNAITKKPRYQEYVEESKKTEDDKQIDMIQTKTEDNTIVIKMGTKI